MPSGPGGSEGESLRSYAHHGEDVAVLAFFGGRRGTFVEAGANHPIESSQTYLLERNGWRGVLIEPNPQMAGLCRLHRPQSQVFECALVEPGGPSEVTLHFEDPTLTEVARVVSTVGEAERPSRRGVSFVCRARLLDDVLAEAGIGQIDFLSVDLEGYEAAALRAFDWKRWKPRLISVEDHCESLATWRRVRSGGYRFLRRIGDNDWYVPLEAPERATTGEMWRLFRKKFLSLPFRRFRRLTRRLRGRDPNR